MDMEWILSSQLFCLGIDLSTSLDSDLIESRYLLLIDKIGEAVNGLFQISSEGPLASSGNELKDSGYPGDLSFPNFMVFNVQQHPDFVRYPWDYLAISKRPLDGEKYPFTITLAELMSVSTTA